MGFRFLEKKKINFLPPEPGVYALKNKEIFYIGKAANLRERIKNHFQQPGFKESLFLEKVKKIGYIKTDSEIEALILEANLIKKYQPKYNVVWRDDKNYFFIGITKEDFPRVFITHQTELKVENWKLKIDYFGPFVEGTSLKTTLKILRKIFPFRSCKTLAKKPCLWYQLERCLAPCLLKSKEIKEISQKNVKNLKKIFQGKKKEVLKNLKKEMKKLAKLEEFEKAAKIRDQIFALQRIFEHKKVFKEKEISLFPKTNSQWKKIEKELQKILKTKKSILRIEAYDVSNIQGKEATGSMITFLEGKPAKNFYRRFKIKIASKPNDVAMIKEIITRRFSHLEWGLPDLILIDGGKGQLKAVKQSLRSNFKHIKVMALAKKKNELFIENQKEPILLKNLPREIFNLILQLRDEAHRFALSYHQKLREKKLKNSNNLRL
jgi:excinuclease ABC subunit C